jgi:hypothetical protein
MRCRPKSTFSVGGYLLPYNNVMSLRATDRVRDARCKSEGVPVHLEESSLIGTTPDFVPGNIDMVNDLAGFYRVPEAGYIVRSPILKP